jgi:glycerol-3-phosphate dehydrogenase
MQREKVINNIESQGVWDILIIGGGATGLGVALDAVSRGLRPLVIEARDFGSGTSSKSTKLVHGGVRYLAQGFVSLVMEALKERKYILSKAPHLSGIQKFIIPAYEVMDVLKYYVGLKIYDLLSFNKSLGKTRWVNKEEVKSIFPKILMNGLKGGIEYTDGFFDDSRLCIDLVNTIEQNNGDCINYFKFSSFELSDGKITSIICTDQKTNQNYKIKAKSYVNATGVYAAEVLDKADVNSKIRITPSQGSHIVLDETLSNQSYGLMIPKTSDGRVLFSIPFKTKTLIGTTDILQDKISDNPEPSEDELKFITQNLCNYLELDKINVSASFAGLRPLASPKEGSAKTKEISRSHKVLISTSGLVSVIGGKWTTFRKMGQDTIDKMVQRGILLAQKSKSFDLAIKSKTEFEGHSFMKEDLPYSINDLEHIIKHEMVETFDDLLSRRTRCIFLSKKSTKEILPKVAEIIKRLKNWSEERMQIELKNFIELHKLEVK